MHKIFIFILLSSIPHLRDIQVEYVLKPTHITFFGVISRQNMETILLNTYLRVIYFILFKKNKKKL